MPKTLCIDFDGVLHGYQSGWKGVDQCPDPPVPGAIAWLRTLLEDQDVKVCIYSSRSKEPLGVIAMANWLERHGLTLQEVARVAFPSQKPAAFLTIDDRALCFRGEFPSLDAIHSFKTWQQK